MRDQSEYDFSASKILRIENTGQVYWTQLLRPILFCEMQLDNYPIGHQICPLKLASVGRGEVEDHQLTVDRPNSHIPNSHTLFSLTET